MRPRSLLAFSRRRAESFELPRIRADLDSLPLSPSFSLSSLLAARSLGVRGLDRRARHALAAGGADGHALCAGAGSRRGRDGAAGRGTVRARLSRRDDEQGRGSAACVNWLYKCIRCAKERDTRVAMRGGERERERERGEGGRTRREWRPARSLSRCARSGSSGRRTSPCRAGW